MLIFVLAGHDFLSDPENCIVAGRQDDERRSRCSPSLWRTQCRRSNQGTNSLQAKWFEPKLISKLKTFSRLHVEIEMVNKQNKITLFILNLVFL